MTLSRRTFTLAVASTSLAGSASGQDKWPAKPITYVGPSPPAARPVAKWAAVIESANIKLE